MPSSRHARTLLGAIVAVAAFPADPAVAAPAATPAPTPCPGTTVTAPAMPPVTPPPAPAPAATASPAATVSIPPPTIPAREVVIGGPKLGTNTLVTDLPAGTPAPPALNATSWVIADATTGDVLAAKAPHALMRPASTLKALTAQVLIPRLDPKASILATDADMAADGTKVGIVTGNRYTVDALFHAMLMASANDAVYALTRTYPGGRAAVMAADNALARHLGALDTVAKDPAGLDVDGQVSSAYDLALIGRNALSNKAFRGYSTTKEITFPGAKRPDGTVAAPFQVGNHNKLLYNYPGAVGVKNGYTTLSHGTFIAAATRGPKTYLLTFMCADGIGWHEMAASLDWAFAQGAKARPVGELVAPGSVDATPSAMPSSTSDMTPATAPTSQAPVAAATTPPGDSPSAVEKWWGAGVLGLALILLGVFGTHRIGRRGHRSIGG